MTALTDKQRILQLEAQVSELTQEVQAWRASDREGTLQSAASVREMDIRSRILSLRPASVGTGHGYGGVVTRLLIAMMDRPGKLFSKAELYKMVVLDPNGDTDIKIVDVRITQVRHLLEWCGLSRAGVETVWGKGYRMRCEAAELLKAALEPQSRAVAA